MKRTLLLADANSNHTRKWILLLQKQNHLVVLFSLYPPSDNWFKVNQIVCHSFFENIKLSFWKKFRYPLAYFHAKKIFTSFKPDIVNAHYATSYGMLGAMLKPEKLIINFWGSDVFVFPKKSFLHAIILRFIISKAHLICSSSSVMSKEINLYTTQTIALIPFGIDMKEYPKKVEQLHSPKSKPIVLGMVKTLEPVYRIDVAIDAVRILNSTFDYKFLLHIAGSGSLDSELKNLASDDVIFHGKIQQNEVAGFMHTLDIFLNTTDFESFGVSTIEAMACGIPIIAHHAGGSTEIISDMKNGILYQPNIPEELAHTILGLVENSAAIPEMVNEAHHLVREKYSVDQSLELIDKYF